MRYFLYIFLLFCFLGFSGNVYAQTRDELLKKKEQTLREIQEANKLLKITSRNKKVSLSRLLIIKKRIRSREELINQIELEIKLIDVRINDNTGVITSLEKDLNKIRDEYARLIYYSFVNNSKEDVWMFILASEDFNQAYRRIKYINQYSDYRKKQLSLIKAIKEVLKIKNDELNRDIDEKLALIGDKEKETFTLNRELESQQSTLVQLRKQEKQLRKDIDEKKKITQRITDQINKLIAEEIKKSKSPSNKMRLTPSEKLLGDNFEKNCGGLPWPTSRGIIVSTFGEHPHPVIKGVKIRNNGVDIATVKDSDARAIYEGEEKKIFTLPGRNRAVIIRHGKYLTVYSNLNEVYVSEGQKVNTKESIGLIGTDPVENKTILHLEIREQFKMLDPEKWLSKN